MTSIWVAVNSYAVFIALVAGSFISLAADRLPRGESLFWPRSHCRGCSRQLNVIDLLPVAGYVIRGGRCATCRTPIGASAPIIEALCGASTLVAVEALEPPRGALVGLALVTAIGVGTVALAFRRSRPRAGQASRMPS